MSTKSQNGVPNSKWAYKEIVPSFTREQTYLSTRTREINWSKMQLTGIIGQARSVKHRFPLNRGITRRMEWIIDDCEVVLGYLEEERDMVKIMYPPKKRGKKVKP